jgi:hypothetical protein
MMVAPDELKLVRESAGQHQAEEVWLWVCECVGVSVGASVGGTHESVCLSDLVPGMVVVGDGCWREPNCPADAVSTQQSCRAIVWRRSFAKDSCWRETVVGERLRTQLCERERCDSQHSYPVERPGLMHDGADVSESPG